MHDRLIDRNDHVMFDKKDFPEAEAKFLIEARGMERLKLPEVDAKHIFVRFSCPRHQAIRTIQEFGDFLAKKFPAAQIKWALNISELEEKIQVLGY